MSDWAVQKILKYGDFTESDLVISRMPQLGGEFWKLNEIVQFYGGRYVRGKCRFEFLQRGSLDLLSHVTSSGTKGVKIYGSIKEIENKNQKLKIITRDNVSANNSNETKEEIIMLKIEKVTLVNGEVSSKIELSKFLQLIENEKKTAESVSGLSALCKTGCRVKKVCKANILKLEKLMDEVYGGKE